MMTFTTRPLGNSNLRLPTLGLGGAPLGGLFEGVDERDAVATLNTAVQQGLYYVDTAPFYGFGLSERRVGDALRGRDYVLSTKVGRLLQPGAAADAAAMGWPQALPFTPIFDYSYDGIMRSFEHSLQRLGLDRIDILYVHDIGEMTHGADNAIYLEQLIGGGIRALESLRAEGVVSAIGAGVNEVPICQTLLRYADWDAFLLAGRFTLLEQAPLHDFLPECAERGTSIVVGGPFNSGVLVGGDTWNYAAAPAPILEKVRQLTAVCDEYQVPLAAAALQFPLGHRSVCSVIPGLRNPHELQQTLAWANLAIPDAFWQALKQRGLIDPEAPTPTNNPFMVESV